MERIEFLKKLETISGLEQDNDIRGIYFCVAEGHEDPSVDSCVDFIISLIGQAASVMNKRSSYPLMSPDN